MTDHQQEGRPYGRDEGQQPTEHGHHAVVFYQGEAEEQDGVGREQVVERYRQRQQQDVDRPGEQQKSPGHAVHPGLLTGVHCFLEPGDEAAGAGEEQLQLAAREAAPADRSRQGRYGAPGKELGQQEQHRNPGDRRQPRDAGGNAVGDVEGEDGEGV